MLASSRFQAYGILSIFGLSATLVHSSAQEHLQAKRWDSTGSSIAPAAEYTETEAHTGDGDDDASLGISFNTVKGGFTKTGGLSHPPTAEPSTLVIRFCVEEAYGQLLKGGIGGSHMHEGSIHRLLYDFTKKNRGKIKIFKDKGYHIPTAWDPQTKIQSTGRRFEITLPEGIDLESVKNDLEKSLNKKAILAIKTQDGAGSKGLAIGVQEPMLIAALSKPDSKLRATIDKIIQEYATTVDTEIRASIVRSPIQAHKDDSGICYLMLFDEKEPGQREGMVRMFRALLSPNITLIPQESPQTQTRERRTLSTQSEKGKNTLGTRTEDDEDNGAGTGF